MGTVTQRVPSTGSDHRWAVEHDLAVVVSAEVDRVVRRVAGDLTHDTTPAVTNAADTACRERRANRARHDAVIDLSRVGRVDVEGLRALDRAVRRLGSNHFRVTFASVPPPLRSLLDTMAAAGTP